MDLHINRDELSRGLSRVQGIIERRSTQPVLSHVLLDAQAGGLVMTATDTEVAFIGTLVAHVEVTGKVAVDAAQLFQVVRSLPEPTLRLQLLPNHQLEIISGRAWFRVPGLPAEDYPALPPFETRSSLQVSERELRRIVDQTHFSVATDDTRFGLNGAHFEGAPLMNGWALRMVATDGHRLCAAEAPVSVEPHIPPQVLVPRKALQVLRKLLEGGGEVVLEFGESAVRLRQGDQSFWFRMLEASFPDYRQVVPKGDGYTVKLRRDEFTSTLRRVQILASERARPVSFWLQDDEVEISISSREKGEVRERLAIEYTGESMKIGFNVRYLLDVLAVLSDEYVQLVVTTPLAPCLIRGAGEESRSSFYVVMPMRID